MNKNYLKEMIDGGYKPEVIDDFHVSVLPYLGFKYFPDKQAKILDIGAGAGHSLLPLRHQGWQNLWAADIDDYNRNFFEKNNVNFNQFDVQQDKFPYGNDFFDVVMSFHLIEHLKDTENYLEEVWRILKEGGVFILVTPDWRKQYKIFWRDHTHVHPYDKEGIARLLRSHNFKLVKVSSFGVLKGIGRTGLWKNFKRLMFTGIDMAVVSKK